MCLETKKKLLQPAKAKDFNKHLIINVMREIPTFANHYPCKNPNIALCAVM